MTMGQANPIHSQDQSTTCTQHHNNQNNDQWIKYCRYWRHYTYFLITLYIISTCFMGASLKYMLQWGWIPSNFLHPWILYLISGLLGLFFVYIAAIARVMRKKEKSTEAPIYIPFAIYEGVSFLFFLIKQETFFLMFFIAQLILITSYMFWRWAQKQDHSSKYIVVVISVILILLASIVVTHCAYIFYNNSDLLSAGMNWMWSIVPNDLSQISDFIAHQSWLAIGITLILACLLIVSWAKDTPCKDWNPFSAYDLKLSNTVLFANLWLLMMLLYGMIIQSNRLIFVIFFALLASSVTTSIYCHHMQSNTYVLGKVKKHLKLFDIKYFGCKGHEILIQKEVNDNIIHEYSHYIIKLQDVCSTIIRHMRDNNCNRQINHSLALIKSIGTRLNHHDCPKNIGFLTGLGLVPPEIDTEVSITDTIIYLTRLLAAVKKLIETPESYDPPFWPKAWEYITYTGKMTYYKILKQTKYYKPSPKPDLDKNIYYRFFTLGMYSALFSLVHTINTSPTDVSEYNEPLNALCLKFEQAIKTDKEISSIAIDLKNTNNGDIRLSINYSEGPVSTIFANNGYLALARLFQQVFCDDSY